MEFEVSNDLVCSKWSLNNFEATADCCVQGIKGVARIVLRILVRKYLPWVDLECLS